MNDVEARILGALELGAMEVATMARALSLHQGTVRRTLSLLVAEGSVRRVHPPRLRRSGRTALTYELAE